MIGEYFGFEWGTLAAIYCALILFGLGFNAVVALAIKRGYADGYMSLFVVAGVGVTLAALAAINLAFALMAAGAFICSGAPMILGSIWRHVKARERLTDELRREARHGNPD